MWGLYPCPFRLFDVDDLILNTLGAVVGSLLAVPLVALLRRGARRRPAVRRVTLGRRWTGMVCDVAWRALGIMVLDLRVDDLPPAIDSVLLWGVPGALQAVLVLSRGQTLGEQVVQVRAVPTSEGLGRGGLLARRVVKLGVGAGGAVVLAAASAPWTGPALLVLAVVTGLAPLATLDPRGLAQALSGQTLELVGGRDAAVAAGSEDPDAGR